MSISGSAHSPGGGSSGGSGGYISGARESRGLGIGDAPSGGSGYGGAGGHDRGGRHSGSINDLMRSFGYDTGFAPSFAGDNYAWSRDPSGRLRAVGMPSLTGHGMMTTAYGAQSGFMDALRDGGLSQAWHAMDISSGDSPYNKDYRANTKARIQQAAAKRAKAYEDVMNDITSKNLPSRFDEMYSEALRSGDLGTLEAGGIDTSGLRATHHGGGVLDGMLSDTGLFDGPYSGKDIQTLPEAYEKLADKNMVAFDPATGTYSWTGNPTYGAGIGAKMFGALAAQNLAEGVYDNNPANIGMAKQVGSWANKASKMLGNALAPQDRGISAIGGLLSAAGYPGSAIAGAYGALDTAADAAYAGFTNDQETYSPGRYGNQEAQGMQTGPQQAFFADLQEQGLTPEQIAMLYPQWGWSGFLG